MYKGHDQYNWGLEQEASNSWCFDMENESQDSGDQELIVKCWGLHWQSSSNRPGLHVSSHFTFSQILANEEIGQAGIIIS